MIRRMDTSTARPDGDTITLEEPVSPSLDATAAVAGATPQCAVSDGPES